MSESDEPQVSRRQLFADLASGLHRGILRATGMEAEPEVAEERIESVQEDDEAFVQRAMTKAEGHLAELQAFMATHQEAGEETEEPGEAQPGVREPD